MSIHDYHREFKLLIEYEEFPDENIIVMTVSKDDEPIYWFQGGQATSIYRLLTGDDEAVLAASEGKLLTKL